MKLYRVQHQEGFAFLSSEREARAMVKKYRSTGGDSSFQPVDIVPNKLGILAALNRLADHPAASAAGLPSLAPKAFTSSVPGVYPSNAGDVPERPVHPSTELAHHFAVANLRLHNALSKRGPAYAEALKVAEEALVWALDLSLFQSGQITEEEWQRRGAKNQKDENIG